MTLTKTLLLLLLASAPLATQHANGADFTPTMNPSFQVDYPSPTADKPQSKLWFMEGCWWALLPRASGPSLWQRTDNGWKEAPEIASALRGTPGRADVWPGAAGVTAAAIAETGKTNGSISVFRLTRKREGSEKRWEAGVLAELRPPTPDDAIETATLVQDTAGTWWVAAVAGVKVCVWTSPSEGTPWSGPLVLAEGVDPDDICAITPLPGNEIGVIWSDQVREAFLMRTHADGAPLGDWRKEDVVQRSAKAADDHLNTCLTPDGTLWVASKNEIDTDGRPQFTLHLRHAGGEWNPWPYGIRTSTTRPSRPIVVANGDGSMVLTGYGDNDRATAFPHDARIVFARVNPAHPEMVEAPRAVIIPDRVHQSFVQNVTGPREPFPAGAPWIVLASDQEGRVYEADLHGAFINVATGDSPSGDLGE